MRLVTLRHGRVADPSDMTCPVAGGQIVAVKMIGQGDANADGVVMSSTRWAPILAAYTDGTLVRQLCRTVTGVHRCDLMPLMVIAWTQY
jgi:hypothetical protein